MAALGKPNVQGFDLTASLAVTRDLRNFDERFEEPLAANVMDIATTSVVSVSEDTSIDEICALLSTKRIKKVPVLAGEQVVGTVAVATSSALSCAPPSAPKLDHGVDRMFFTCIAIAIVSISLRV